MGANADGSSHGPCYSLFEIEGGLTHQTVRAASAESQQQLRTALLLLLGGRALSVALGGGGQGSFHAWPADPPRCEPSPAQA